MAAGDATCRNVHLLSRLLAPSPTFPPARLPAWLKACEALAATVPAAALLLWRLRVIPDVALRVCVCLGLHEVSRAAAGERRGI